MGGVEFLKGHGTRNDFVLLPDPGGELDLTVERVRALCDRRGGIGADGVLRVVRSGALPGLYPGVKSIDDDGVWFMDYRNGDGSLAEMCGNGARVFGRYLREAGLVDGAEFVIGTRAGERGVTANDDGTFTVDMGATRPCAVRSAVFIDGTAYDVTGVDLGNPHAVALVGEPVPDIDLTREPEYDPEDFPDGVNVEFVNVLEDGLLRMRVFERGVGETMSCGSGTVAAVHEYVRRRGQGGWGEADVLVPGGRLSARVRPGASTLTGPAEIVARGELDERWWKEAAR